MLGRTHLVIGTAGALLLTGTGLSGIGAAAVGSLLPDLDQTQSTASRAFLPWGRKTGPASIVLVGVLYWASTLLNSHSRYQPVTLALAGLLLAAGLITQHRTVTHSLLGTIWATALVWMVLPKLALPFAVGYILHLAADMVSGKLTLLWPYNRWFGICILPTSGIGDLAIRLASLGLIGTHFLV